MAYIGRGLDKISNVEKLDNLTFDGSSTSFALQKGGSSFIPSSANNILLSIDGVVQAGNFTVSGSTIDFGTAISGSSTCDFILHYGVGLITAPADGTVTTAKLADSSVSLAKLTATGTKDATTFLRGDNTFATPAGGTNTPAFSITKNANQSTSAGSNVLITWQATNLDTDSGVDLSNNKYVVPSGKDGNYFLSLQVSFDYGTRFILSIFKNGTAIRQLDTGGGTSGETALNFNAILALAASDELTAYYYSVTSTGNIRYENSSGTQITRFEGYKIIE